MPNNAYSVHNNGFSMHNIGPLDLTSMCLPVAYMRSEICMNLQKAMLHEATSVHKNTSMECMLQIEDGKEEVKFELIPAQVERLELAPVC